MIRALGMLFIALLAVAAVLYEVSLLEDAMDCLGRQC